MMFSFSDLIAGYVTSPDRGAGTFGLRTSDGREFEARITPITYAELVRNLGEPYTDSTAQIWDMLTADRYLFAYGIFYPERGGHTFDAKHLVFLDRGPSEYRFEKPDWWVRQIRALANFYLRAEFGDGPVNYRDYRTKLGLAGVKTSDFRQETDTISRLIYGFATAFLMTGEDRFLEAAEAGTRYLRDHMRFVDTQEGIAYWYHAIDVSGAHERKIFASEFGDDYDAIPMYEQIYALAGPTQTYRATGDPLILRDIEMTLRLFDRYFLDPQHGGYFSHADPITLDPKSPALGANRARKNWNSVGDHAPAYLINLWLATGEEKHAAMLAYTADTVAQRFPDYEHSPFVQERFHEDWSHDKSWGWQQNRAVVGHNLKIAWNLMRIHHLRPNDAYQSLAEKIAEVMPKVGMDRQRGGWYDVMERELGPGEEVHRFVWHDRKAWWQQEQGILAYLILAGSLKNDEYLRLGRESAAFYNAMFLDHDDSGIYFNVLSNGLPYLMGTERMKGSHSMSGYHSFELAYLAAVYSNLLITHQEMDLYFKPKPGGFKDGILRVQPDILPPGSIVIGDVWIDGERYDDFDAKALTVKLPATDRDVKVRVRLVPVVSTPKCVIMSDVADETGKLTLAGKLDKDSLNAFEDELQETLAGQPRRLVLDTSELQSIDQVALRALIFALHKLGPDVDLHLVGANAAVREAFANADVSVIASDEAPAELTPA
jgi:mannose/cellobiose epimerase-like protein (N-acyl-D-glucosamine 2-epimerase family)/anti-anti-sigma regulatory factor